MDLTAFYDHEFDEHEAFVRALQAARETGMVAAALTSRGVGDLPGLADPQVMVPSTTIVRI